MFGRIAPRYDFLNVALSGGLDRYWRLLLSRQVKKQCPARVLDLATGSGDVILSLKKQKAFSQFCVGADFSLGMLLQARQKKLSRLCAADALKLPFRDQSFDAITIAFGFRNFTERISALRELKRILTPNGSLYILEFSHPFRPLRKLYFGYLNHLLPLVAGLFTREVAAYRYLGDSIAAFPDPPSLSKILKEAGFEKVEYQKITGGIVALHLASLSN